MKAPLGHDGPGSTACLLAVALFLVASASALPSSPVGSTEPAKRFLLYRVDPLEGFNLRRDAFLRAALLTRSLGPEWTLVLPPFEHLPHWHSSELDQSNVPWSVFFDLVELRRAVNVVEYREFRARHPEGLDLAWTLHLGSLRADGAPSLGEPEPCPEDPVWLADADGIATTAFGDRLPVERRECRAASLSSSAMAPVLADLDARAVLVDRFETLRWDTSYDGPEYWQVRAAMVFAADLRARAEAFVQARFGDEPYLAVHLRRGDFLRTGRPVPSLEDVADQVSRALRAGGLERVFLATDGSDEEVAELGRRLAFERFQPEPDEPLLDGVVAMIDQWVAVRANRFLGTDGSTFSTVIMEERQLRGAPPESTFAVLCRGTPEPKNPAATRFDCPQPRPRAVAPPPR